MPCAAPSMTMSAPIEVVRGTLRDHIAVALHIQAVEIVVAILVPLRAVVQHSSSGVSSQQSSRRGIAHLLLCLDEAGDKTRAEPLVAKRHHRKHVKFFLVVHLDGGERGPQLAAAKGDLSRTLPLRIWEKSGVR